MTKAEDLREFLADHEGVIRLALERANCVQVLTRTFGRAELEAICDVSGKLLDACMATMEYWYACAQSGPDIEQETRHPGCHLSVDTPELQALCNKAAELTAAGVYAAGVTVIDGLPIRPSRLPERQEGATDGSEAPHAPQR